MKRLAASLQAETIVQKLILNGEHLSAALGQAIATCRHRLFIATADVKNLHIPLPAPARGRRTARSVVDVLDELGRRGVEVRLLHSGVPSGSFLAAFKSRLPHGLVMRRCVRIHAKIVCADGKWMYLGSANLTGAGLGAKSPRRRNFEAGVWTDETAIIDPVMDMLQSIWDGTRCTSCGRKEHCPVPLEEPAL